MTDPHAAIDRDFDAHLERIRAFLRIPSVSADDGDLRSTADAVCGLIALAGGTAAPREPGEQRPTVLGVIDGPGPTVLRYGMYDVQPPGAQWTVDPFGATARDGRVICRGAANSKGALAASILAFASVPSPCRQVFVCEGEEELGSPRLAAFCDAHRDELAGDYALDFDLQEQPGSIFAGVKGLYELELFAGGGPDVHSSRVAEVREPGERRPTVIGVIDGPGPTVLRYGMYDVQPPGAQWTVDPFAAHVRRDRVIARGAANSKAALAASILAFAGAPSPCRQVFVCEGEEELGSPRLAAFCDAHRDELRADFALDLDLQEDPGSVFAGVKACTSSSWWPAAARTSTRRASPRYPRRRWTWRARSWRSRRPFRRPT